MTDHITDDAQSLGMREAMEEIANRAGNYADPDAGDWMESIYKIANAALAAPVETAKLSPNECGRECQYYDYFEMLAVQEKCLR